MFSKGGRKRYTAAMNTLIVYDASSSSVEECVRLLESRLSGSVTTYSFGSRLPAPDLDAYDEVILGGAVGFSGVPSSLTSFCGRERTRLLGKKLGLFLCTPEAPEKGERHFRDFPRDILDHAAVLGLFGSTGDFGDKNFLNKLVSSQAARLSDSKSYRIEKDRIAEFADKFEASR